jgi:hypothetical protein
MDIEPIKVEFADDIGLHGAMLVHFHKQLLANSCVAILVQELFQ